MLKCLSLFMLIAALLLSGCNSAPGSAGNSEGSSVLAVESFLADIAQNVAGDRMTIGTLIPMGVDPHTYEPAPSDLAKINDSQALIINGSGFEAFLENILENSVGDTVIIDASQELTPRTPSGGEPAAEDDHEVDPHFWLDPNLVVTYVENIQAGLTQIDPDGADTYAQNAQAYIEQLKELDAWIQEQVNKIPPDDRLMVTNHESFGYFADRYGFTIIGAVIPSVSAGSSPTPQDLASLADKIRSTGAKAIFLEAGANPQIAEQLAQETGVRVSPPLYTHSLTEPGGDAPTYIDMIRFNVTTIVNALSN